MKQLFLASTFFEVACLAAGIDSGAYDVRYTPGADLRGGGHPEDISAAVDERILVAANNAVVTELTAPIYQFEGIAPLLKRFDRVVYLNDFVFPNHPSSWAPRDGELHIIERALRREWELGDSEIELILESPQVNPAIALGRIFRNSLIRVYADGLMSYGPTRNKIPLTNGQRLTSLHYLPLAPELTPRLLSEFNIKPVALDVEPFRDIVDELAQELSSHLPAEILELEQSDTALAVGQYLSALDIIEAHEEDSLHVSFVDAAKDRGMKNLVFKPHPAAPPTYLLSMQKRAQDLGINLVVFESPIIAEVLLARLRPALVIGCFSTLLATAKHIFGSTVAAVGTQLLLERIAPYQNSNRIPVTIADYAFGAGKPTRPNAYEFQDLVDTVSYAMQAEIVAHLRPTAQRFLSTHHAEDYSRYFKKRRLSSLSLPGGLAQNHSLKSRARRTVVFGGTVAALRVRSGIKHLSERRKSAD